MKDFKLDIFIWLSN